MEHTQEVHQIVRLNETLNPRITKRVKDLCQSMSDDPELFNNDDEIILEIEKEREQKEEETENSDIDSESEGEDDEEEEDAKKFKEGDIKSATLEDYYAIKNKRHPLSTQHHSYVKDQATSSGLSTADNHPPIDEEDEKDDVLVNSEEYRKGLKKIGRVNNLLITGLDITDIVQNIGQVQAEILINRINNFILLIKETPSIMNNINKTADLENPYWRVDVEDDNASTTNDFEPISEDYQNNITEVSEERRTIVIPSFYERESPLELYKGTHWSEWELYGKKKGLLDESTVIMVLNANKILAQVLTAYDISKAELI